MIKQHATQSVRDHHLMNELVGYAGLFINLQKGCFPEAKKQIDCAHMNIYRTKGRCQHTFRQWSISLVTQQLGEKQIGPIWWISVALIKEFCLSIGEMKIWWHLFWFAENWILWKLLLICPLAETLSVCGQQLKVQTTTVWTLSYTVASSHCTRAHVRSLSFSSWSVFG